MKIASQGSGSPTQHNLNVAAGLWVEMAVSIENLLPIYLPWLDFTGKCGSYPSLKFNCSVLKIHRQER